MWRHIHEPQKCGDIWRMKANYTDLTKTVVSPCAIASTKGLVESQYGTHIKWQEYYSQLCDNVVVFIDVINAGKIGAHCKTFRPGCRLVYSGSSWRVVAIESVYSPSTAGRTRWTRHQQCYKNSYQYRYITLEYWCQLSRSVSESTYSYSNSAESTHRRMHLVVHPSRFIFISVYQYSIHRYK